jgi:hypothetical protein
VAALTLEKCPWPFKEAAGSWFAINEWKALHKSGAGYPDANRGILKHMTGKGFGVDSSKGGQLTGSQPFQIGMVIFQNGELFCFSPGCFVKHRMIRFMFDQAQHLIIL